MAADPSECVRRTFANTPGPVKSQMIAAPAGDVSARLPSKGRSTAGTSRTADRFFRTGRRRGRKKWCWTANSRREYGPRSTGLRLREGRVRDDDTIGDTSIAAEISRPSASPPPHPRETSGDSVQSERQVSGLTFVASGKGGAVIGFAGLARKLTHVVVAQPADVAAGRRHVAVCSKRLRSM